MRISEITIVKEHLDQLKVNGFIAEWELPYESLLTRRSAAIFFVTLTAKAQNTDFWTEFEKYDNFSKRFNEDKKLSALDYRITFNKEEKEKNAGLAEMV